MVCPVVGTPSAVGTLLEPQQGCCWGEWPPGLPGGMQGVASKPLPKALGGLPVQEDPLLASPHSAGAVHGAGAILPWEERGGPAPGEGSPPPPSCHFPGVGALLRLFFDQ